MDGYLKRRLSNPAYGGGTLDESSAYKRFAFERSVDEQKPTNSHPLQMARYEASAGKLYRATDNAKQGTCWTGYHRVEGTAQYAPGSCAKDGEKKKSGEKKKKKKKKKEKKEGDKSSSSESDSDDENKKKSKD